MEKNTGGDPKVLAAGRAFLKSPFGHDDYVSDQMKELPMPHLTKPPMGGPQTSLPQDFDAYITQPDYHTLLRERMSHRNFKRTPMTLGQLSFLLWSAQGITAVRGNHYAYFRTAPSGGARHPFETYLTVHNVDGLEPGVYHYLPEPHALERIGEAPEDFTGKVSHMLCDQAWCKRAGVVFFFSAEIYRAEWRYCTSAHRVVLIDVGHAMQNLYLACHAVGLGACAIAAFRQEACDSMFGLDGQEEFTLYAAPVGTVDPPKRPRALAPGLTFEPTTGEEEEEA